MNILHDARKRVKALAVDAKHVLALDEALDEIGDLAKETDAAKRAADVARAQQADAEGQLATVTATLGRATDELAAVKKAAQETAARAAQELAAARDQAAGIVGAAKQNATDLVAAAQSQGEAVIAASRTEAQSVLDGVRAAEGDLQALNGQIAGARQVLAEVNAEIERVKRKFS